MGYAYMLAVLAACTGMAFIYRWSERRQADRMVMVAAMGAAATVCIVAHILGFGVDLRTAHPSEWAIGAVLCLLGLTGIPCFLAAVARGDLSITWTILTLTFAPASAMSMIYPGETARPLGVFGLVLAAAAIVLLGLDMAQRHRSGRPDKPRKGWWLFMSLAAATNALSMYAYKLASALPERLGAPASPGASAANTAAFLLVTYAGIAVLAPIALALMGRRGTFGPGAGIGALGGLVIVVLGFFMMATLSSGIPGYLVFPVTSGGGNVVVAALSFVFLKERPSAFGWAGLVVGLASFVVFGFAMASPA